MAWLGLRWLLAQVRVTEVSGINVRSEGEGTTEVHAVGAAAAVARDIEDYPGVRWARARFVNGGSIPSST